jgi:peptidoglycan hydrolase CwlO-like protein
MKKSYFLVLIMSASIVSLVSQTVQAQPTVNFTKLFQDKFTRVQNSDPRVPSETYQDVRVR